MVYLWFINGLSMVFQLCLNCFSIVFQWFSRVSRNLNGFKGFQGFQEFIGVFKGFQKRGRESATQNRLRDS